jgi:PKD repeat protein
MANRHWVGGSGNWNDTAHWAATSGGAGGQSVPTSSDDVFLSSGGSSVYITLNVDGDCRDITYSNRIQINNGTNIGVSNFTLNVYGSYIVTYNSNPTFTCADVVFRATTTGKTIGGFTGHSILPKNSVTFNGVGGEWTIQTDGWISGSGSGSSPTLNRDVIVENGSFISNGKDFSITGLKSSFSNVRNIDIDGSTILIGVRSGSATVTGWDMTVTTNLTFNAGTSTISTDSSGLHDVNFYGGGLTYYNLILDKNVSAYKTYRIYDSNTFNNVTLGFSSGQNAFTLELEQNETQTINGIFSATGFSTSPSAFFTPSTNSGPAPLNVSFADGSTFGKVILLRSTTSGVPTTISAASVSLSYVDVKDITAIGAASPFNVSGTGNINRGNNTGWTFPVASPWAWDFTDNGSTDSTIENPTYIYPGGHFTAKLTVTNGAGSSTHTEEIISIPNMYLQTTFLVGSNTDGNVQTIGAGKSDNFITDEENSGNPIFYELETQDLEFGNRSHLKKLADKIVVFSKDAGESQLAVKEDGGNYQSIPVFLNDRVNIEQNFNAEGHFLNVKWSGSSSTVSPILEGMLMTDIFDMGNTDK